MAQSGDASHSLAIDEMKIARGSRYPLVGFACWATFHMASHAIKRIQQSTLDVVERVGGFILAAMAVDMMAAGLCGLFPMLTPG